MIDLRERVAVVTGAGRGIGHTYAMRLAAYGARVVVNDAGVATDGAATDEDPAADVVHEITAAGGEAVAHRGDIARGGRGRRARGTRARHVGTPRHRDQQRGLRPAPHGLQPERRRVGRRRPRAPPRHVRGVASRVQALAGGGEARRHHVRPADQHRDRPARLRRRGPVELRRGQGRHPGLHRGRRHRDGAVRRDGEHNHARCEHAARADRMALGAQRGRRRTGRLRSTRSGARRRVRCVSRVTRRGLDLGQTFQVRGGTVEHIDTWSVRDSAHSPDRGFTADDYRAEISRLFGAAAKRADPPPPEWKAK